MNELYWIGRIGAIYNFCIALIVFSTIALILSFSVYVTIRSDCEEPTTGFRRFVKGTIAALIFGILGVIFIPSPREVYAIYGIGTVIDYVQDNQTAKGIPEKAIKAIDQYLEQYNEKGGEQ